MAPDKLFMGLMLGTNRKRLREVLMNLRRRSIAVMRAIFPP
jgi:hypothetical protein